MNKAIHEFNACIFVLLLNAHISHIDLFIARSFGFLYYVYYYYHEVIICAARITKFFIFIFISQTAGDYDYKVTHSNAFTRH